MASHCLFVDTSVRIKRRTVETYLAVMINEEETVASFKENFCKDHKVTYPKYGEITISALKVNLGSLEYQLADSLLLSKVFECTGKEWRLNADAVKVEEEPKMLKIKSEDGVFSKENNVEEDLGHGLTTGQEVKKKKRTRKDDNKRETEVGGGDAHVLMSDENQNLIDDVPKDNGEIDNVEGKSLLSSKRKKSKKAKTLAQEETLVV